MVRHLKQRSVTAFSSSVLIEWSSSVVQSSKGINVTGHSRDVKRTVHQQFHNTLDSGTTRCFHFTQGLEAVGGGSGRHFTTIVVRVTVAVEN